MERLQELVEEQVDQANGEKIGQAEEVADNLEAEIRALRKRDGEMKDLARCEDHIHYLQVGEGMRQDKGEPCHPPTVYVLSPP